MHIIRQWKFFLTCWGLRKPKYEPFITHIRGTLKDKNDKGRTWQWGIFLQLWKLLEVVKHWRKTYGFACLLQMFFKEKYYFCYFITQNRVFWLLWSIISIINTFNATWHLIKYRSILWRKSFETIYDESKTVSDISVSICIEKSIFLTTLCRFSDLNTLMTYYICQTVQYLTSTLLLNNYL